MKKLSKILFGIALLGIMSFAVPVTLTSAHAEAQVPNVDLPFEH